MWTSLVRTTKHTSLLKTISKSFFGEKCAWTFSNPGNIPIEGTIQDCRNELTKLMGISHSYNPLAKESDRAYLNDYLPSNQQELPARTMSDSFTAASIPLSKDLNLQDKYITFLGSTRLGRLLEDMDIFAVFVAQKHILNPKQPKDLPSPYTLVTVLVDKIEFTNFSPKPTEDIRLSGHVSWVGKSSIEVVVLLEQNDEGRWKTLTQALFLMAARNPTAERSALVNPLIATNDEERRILDGGEIRKKQRFVAESQHLHKVVPTMEEQTLIHNLFLRTKEVGEVSLIKHSLPPNCAWMKASTLSNMVFSQPENRNLHNHVFGGFLMRQALELSWALGFTYTKQRPSLRCISNVTFHKPILVNSLIRMKALIVYTENQFFQVTVFAESVDAVSGKDVTANVFHFTYEVPSIVKEVFPKSYEEAMLYIEGRRHFCHTSSRFTVSAVP